MFFGIGLKGNRRTYLSYNEMYWLMKYLTIAEILIEKKITISEKFLFDLHLMRITKCIILLEEANILRNFLLKKIYSIYSNIRF